MRDHKKITLRHKLKEQFPVRTDHMDVNEHERDHPTLHLDTN